MAVEAHKHGFIWRLDGEKPIKEGFVYPAEQAMDTYRQYRRFRKLIRDGMNEIFKREFKKLGGWKRVWHDGDHRSWVSEGLWGNLSEWVMKRWEVTDVQADIFQYIYDQSNTNIAGDMRKAIYYFETHLDAFGDFSSLYVPKEWYEFIHKWNTPLSDWLSEDDFFFTESGERYSVVTANIVREFREIVKGEKRGSKE